MRSTVVSQQEGCGFKSRMVQHVGACSRAFLCGVCMFSHPGSPHRTPQQKHAEEQMLFGPVPDHDRTGHLDLVPGRRNDGCPLLLAFPGGGRPGWEKCRGDIPPTFHLNVCVCVCVALTVFVVCMPCGY